MYKAIFRNRWIAMLWVLGMLVSVGLFFARGGGQEKLAQATRHMASDKAALEEAPAQAGTLVSDEAASDDEVGDDDEEASDGEHRTNNNLRGRTLTLATRPAAGEEAEGDGAETYVVIEKSSHQEDDRAEY